MNKAEILTRKRAIFTALQPCLADTEVMEALILWESRYHDTPKFALRYFIEDFSKTIKRPQDAKKLFIRLVTTMNKPEQDLLPDPSAALQAYIKRRDIALMRHDTVAEIEAFQVLVDKWLSLADPSAAADVSRFVANNLGGLNIDFELRAQVTRWITDETATIKVQSADLKDLRKIINVFYIGFCEYVGPVKSDALLAESVTRLKFNGGAVFASLFAKLL